MKKEKGITLIALVITIILMLILAGVVLYFTVGNGGMIEKAKIAKEETSKTTATEKINLKITNSQMKSYAEEQRMPTLQELANDFCEDNEIQYVTLKSSKKVASLEKIDVGKSTSIFTKLKEYPYEFEINGSLQLASIDGIKIASTKQEEESTNWKLWKKETAHTSEENAMQLPENFNELLIDLGCEGHYYYTWVITKEMLISDYKQYMAGAGVGSNKIYAKIRINANKIFVDDYMDWGENLKNVAELSVYYK